LRRRGESRDTAAEGTQYCVDLGPGFRQGDEYGEFANRIIRLTHTTGVV